MTQQIVNELREIAHELAAESRKARRRDRIEKFQRLAQKVWNCADDLGDD